ncbi:MAG: PorT family protein [Bacteroidetes bacterium]|nr:MAG: PorT family protein [Bacteroidota bacterium]
MSRIVTAMLLLILSATGFSQNRIRFSVLAEPQFSWFSSDEQEVEPDGSILHIRTGLQMDNYFEPTYAFVLGFAVNNTGGKLLYADSTLFEAGGDSLVAVPGVSIRHRLQYLEIPIGLKLKTEELGYATFFLQAGFNPMVNINAFAVSGDEVFDKENIQDDINTFYLGYHVGAGVEYRLGGNTALLGGIRWSSGLTDVTGNDRANITQRAITVNLGVLF